MSFTSYADMIDYPKIRKIIGDQWINEARVASLSIVERNPLSNQGTYEYTLRERTFQDTSGQSLAAGDPISSSKRSQLSVKHPKCWRYGSLDEPDVIMDFEVKDAARENASLADAIRIAGSQCVDDSTVSVIKGTSEALSGNQYGTGATTISLDEIVSAIAKLDDRGLELNGGAMLGNSAVYWKLVKLGLVALTTNTYGVEAQNRMVVMGQLPMNLLGMTFVMSNKFAAVSSNVYYVYLVGPGALQLHGGDAPFVEGGRKTAQKEFATVTNFRVLFGLGFKGVTYGGTMSEKITDTNLETSGNWTLAAPDSNQVRLARLYTTVA